MFWLFFSAWPSQSDCVLTIYKAAMEKAFFFSFSVLNHNTLRINFFKFMTEFKMRFLRKECWYLGLKAIQTFRSHSGWLTIPAVWLLIMRMAKLYRCLRFPEPTKFCLCTCPNIWVMTALSSQEKELKWYLSTWNPESFTGNVFRVPNYYET